MLRILLLLSIAFSSIALGSQNSGSPGELEKKREEYFLAEFISGWDQKKKNDAWRSYGKKERLNLFLHYKDEYNRGNKSRSFDLARIFLEGDIDESYSHQVVNWLIESIPTSQGRAEAILGFLHETGRFVEKDRNRAIDYYEQGWSKEDASAAYHLARIRLPELSSREEKEEFVRFTNIARQKNYDRYGGERGMLRVYRETNAELTGNLLGPIAFELAVDYAEGNDIEKNLEQAASYYAAAAFSGIQKANLELAYMFQSGNGVEKNEQQATTYFYRAAFCWTFPEVMEREEPFRYDEALCEVAAAELEKISSEYRQARKSYKPAEIDPFPQWAEDQLVETWATMR